AGAGEIIRRHSGRQRYRLFNLAAAAGSVRFIYCRTVRQWLLPSARQPPTGRTQPARLATTPTGAQPGTTDADASGLEFSGLGYPLLGKRPAQPQRRCDQPVQRSGLAAATATAWLGNPLLALPAAWWLLAAGVNPHQRLRFPFYLCHSGMDPQ